VKATTLITNVMILLTAIVGCSKDEATGPQQGTTGTLKVLMVDAPAAYDAVNIVIDSVEAHVTQSDTIKGWTTLNRTSKTYDLLKLANGASAVIGSAVLPAGKYSQIRLFIGSGSNVVVSGITNALTVPSGAQSGLKLNINADIQADMTYELVLDFDANKSIEANNNKYNLKPTIRTVAIATTGIISGTISPAVAHPTIWAIAALDSFSTVADTAGIFKLAYLDPGTYSVRILPKDQTAYRDTLLTGKVVTAGATLSLETIILTNK